MPSPHSLLRLTSKLYNTPLLLSQQSFKSLEQYLSLRNTGLMVPMQMPEQGTTEDPDNIDDIAGVGVIQIYGPLTNKSTGFEALCGGCSYEAIAEQVDDMIDAGCSTIVLAIDSGGGEANGVFDCAVTIRKQCDAAGVRLIAYNEGSCCSAAYAIACCADEVVSNKLSETGSVGVLVGLCDNSKQMEMSGVKPVWITAGKEKIPFAEDGSFRQSFLEDLQVKVDYLYDAFVEHVSTYTGLPAEDIKSTEARTYMAEDAMKIGLINKVMSSAEFVDYIVSIQREAGTNA